MEFQIRDNCLIKYTGDNPIVVIPDDVTEICYSAFLGNNDISEITIPENVLRISGYAFAECKKLKTVNILGNPILETGVFYRCENLKELNAPIPLTEINQSAFAGCTNLESSILSNKTFELYTLTDNRSLNEISYLKNTDFYKETYSWEQYKNIMAETLDYVLIYSKEEYDELFGPLTPEASESNTPITDDVIVVKDGHFVGCALKIEHVGNNILTGNDSTENLKLLRLTDSSISLCYASGGGLEHYAYINTNAFFRRCDDPTVWIGKANSYRKLK